jgi:3-oxoacyl-[acyl-carrier protein] reductase
LKGGIQLDLGLKNKVSFVTGASKGIGSSTAKLLAEEGSDVIVGYGKDDDGAEKVAKYIESIGRKSWKCSLDVGNSENVVNALTQLSGLVPKIDIVVLNAGVNIVKPFEEVSFEDWDKVVNINLNGTFYVLKSILPLLSENASVVIVSSVAAHTGVPQHPHYAAAKAGLVNLTKSASRALSPRIRVNCVAPGMTLTEMGSEASSAQSDDYARTKLLSHRFALPEEIAQSIVYIASPAAGFIYGATLDINGGRYLR